MRRLAALAVLAPLGAALLGDCAMPHAHVDPSVGTHADGGSDAPDAAPIDKGFLSLEDAARLCSFLFTCPNLQASVSNSLRLPIDVRSFSNCVDELSGPVPKNRPGIVQATSALECAAQAANCPAASACMLLEYIDASDPRCQVTSGGDGCSNDGHSVYKCTQQLVLHCDNPFYHPGSVCLLNSLDEYWCAVATGCSLDDYCSGSVVTFCGGQTYSLDCAVTGASCGTDPAGNVHCLVDGVNPLCPTLGVTCVGSHVRYCDGYAYADLDCAALSGYCEPSPSPHCARTTDACAQSDATLNQCSGDSISLCVGGRPEAFDCTSLNMKCVAGTSPQSAHCE